MFTLSSSPSPRGAAGWSRSRRRAEPNTTRLTPRESRRTRAPRRRRAAGGRRRAAVTLGPVSTLARLAWRNLLRHPWRSVATVLGIGLGIAAVLTTLSVGDNVEANLRSTLQAAAGKADLVVTRSEERRVGTEEAARWRSGACNK